MRERFCYVGVHVLGLSKPTKGMPYTCFLLFFWDVVGLMDGLAADVLTKECF